MFWRYLQAFEYEKCASRNSTTFVISDVSASPVDQFAVALSGICSHRSAYPIGLTVGDIVTDR